MRYLLLLVLLVTACDQATAPGDLGADGLKCLLKGDTIGMVIAYKGATADTVWLLAQRDTGCH